MRRWKDRHLLGVIGRDVLHGGSVADVGAGVTAIAEASLEGALGAFASTLPLAVIALGRFGGAELSYASDLDVVFVYEGATPTDFEEATRLAMGVRRFVAGPTPAERIWSVDLDLRPEGKQGPVARSVDGYATYFQRWAHVWERQAMLRARPVAGDRDVARRFMALLEEFVWQPGVSDDDVRQIRRTKARIERERIPPREDPAFHLKLGRGSLSDVEWTVQLLQLARGIRSPSTAGAIEALVEHDVLDRSDADVLAVAYRFCEATRNRLCLVANGPETRSRPRSRRSSCGWPARSRPRRHGSARTTAASPVAPAASSSGCSTASTDSRTVGERSRSAAGRRVVR